jgi:glycerol-3-phosphate acyltransferase PlsX
VVVLDLGANVDCTARQLCEFAEMGMAYSTYLLGVQNPRVGLLNIGEEEAKGTQVSKEVHRALTAAKHVNFVGNVEPKAMYNGAADVVVCDGFIGNVILKTSEAVASVMGKLMKEKLTSSSMNKLGALMARSALTDIKETVDPNYHPGAPLLGINGIVIITHGSCTALGIRNAIIGAGEALKNRLNDHIRENIEKLRASEEQPPLAEAAS